MLYLKFIHTVTKKEKKTVHIEKSLIIGRGVLADISLDDDESISRLHTLVVLRPDYRVEIRDLSSKEGTFVVQSGKQKQIVPGPIGIGYIEGRATLAIGDKFFVGNYEVDICHEEIIGEPTIGIDDDEEEITGIEEIDNLRNK